MKRISLSLLVFLLSLAFPSFLSADQSDPARDAAVEQAKQDYKIFLEQLKALNSQYKEVTSQIKEVVREEGVPTFDEETGDIKMVRPDDDDWGQPARNNFTSGPVFGDVDVRENSKEMIVKVDLPGVKKEDIKVRVEDNKILRIFGRRDNDKEDFWTRSNARYTRSERQRGHFHRRIDLPAEARESGIEAKYENGVLTVRIPKVAQAKKEVEVRIA